MKLFDKYKNYSDDLKAFCINQDRYRPYWMKYSKYVEEIKKYYSLFINNDLDLKYFNKLIKFCNKHIELEPILNKCRIEENKINDTNYPLPNSSIAYKNMIMAYEKLGNYNIALNLCYEAISKGYTEDGTKYGYKGRIKRLEKKLKE